MSARYAIATDSSIGFVLGDYDLARPLTLDPTLAYSTYLGGSRSGYGYGIAMDASGNAYVTGYTYSTDFPTSPGAYNTGYNGSNDTFDKAQHGTTFGVHLTEKAKLPLELDLSPQASL